LNVNFGCDPSLPAIWSGGQNNGEEIMNRLLGAFAGALMIAALSGCSSGASVYGGIQRIDTNAHTVTLYNGTVYTFDANTDLTKVKVADPVKITFVADVATRKNNASSISLYQQ
jgi:hypothetical protein